MPYEARRRVPPQISGPGGTLWRVPPQIFGRCELVVASISSTWYDYETILMYILIYLFNGSNIFMNMLLIVIDCWIFQIRMG